MHQSELAMKINNLLSLMLQIFLPSFKKNFFKESVWPNLQYTDTDLLKVNKNNNSDDTVQKVLNTGKRKGEMKRDVIDYVIYDF